MRTLIAGAQLLAALATAAAAAGEPALAPGLYQIEVRIALPNVQDVAAPMVFTRCISVPDVQSGRAFALLSDNPLKACDLVDYRVTDARAMYRIACPGPNKGSAVGMFELAPSAYRGVIDMNMGGKNMTMSETQVGRRTGDCR
jgi:hypothetical protein